MRTLELPDIDITREMPQETFTIIVEAPNGTTQSHTLTVRRVESSDVNLASLMVGGAIPTLSDLALDDDKNTYTATIPEGMRNTIVNAVANDRFATVDILENGVVVVDGNQSVERVVTIDDTGSSQTLMIKVTAQNGTTSRTYTLTVMRAESSDAGLRSPLMVEGAEPLVLRDDLNEYIVTVPEGMMNTTVTAVANDAFAQSVTIDEARSMLIDGFQRTEQRVDLAPDRKYSNCDDHSDRAKWYDQNLHFDGDACREFGGEFGFTGCGWRDSEPQ